MLFPTVIILSSLIALTLSSPMGDSQLAPRADPTSPFYPCGSTAAEISACPYRCYNSTGTLSKFCYTKESATTAINTLKSICVKCEIPDQPEDTPGACAPLSEYFAGLRPSRCGFENHRERECAWNCGAAQVPFSICDAQNTTGPFRSCDKCKPQCSSPRIVFKPDYLPSNFSIAAGSCSSQYGPQQNVACPWRCTDAGNPNSYCSLDDKTGNNGFTSCVKCV
jgi:hypothetical protein